jgi:hypothetical protein
MKTKIILATIIGVVAQFATAGDFERAVIVPEDVTMISDYAFSGQTNLTCVYLPDSVTAIGVGAFEGCLNLECVRMSPNVTTIGRFAFEGCSHLNHIYVPNDTARRQYISYNWWSMSADVKPWVRYTRSGDALTLIFEGTLEASDDLQNWVEIESPGLYTHKKDTKFFRTKKEEN